MALTLCGWFRDGGVDRFKTTNDKVRKKVLGLIRKWNEVFKEGDEGEIMHELYDRLSKSEFCYCLLRAGCGLEEGPIADESVFPHLLKTASTRKL